MPVRTPTIFTLAALAGTTALGVHFASTLKAMRSRSDPHSERDILAIDGSLRFVESSDGTRIRILEMGPRSGPVAVLVHGFVSTGTIWTMVAEQLVDHGYRVVIPDQRDHGASSLGSDGHCLESLGPDLAAVLWSLPGDDAVTLVGHSMGVISAIGLNRHHPKLAKSIIDRYVLVSPLPKGRGKPPLLELKRHFLATAWYEKARNVRPLGLYCTRMALGPTAPFSAVEATYDMYLAASGAVIENFGRELLTFDFSTNLAQMSAPATLLVGTADTKTPPNVAKAMADRMPNSTVVELPGIGHMAPLEDPSAIVTAITARQ
jgi:pimeloyl-ACP methyl ester carboxylesterase